MRFELDFPVVDNNYRTPAMQGGWFARVFPSLSFYMNMVQTVLRSARLAKKGIYNDPNWCRSSYDILKSLEAVSITAVVENLQTVVNCKGPVVIVGNHMSTLETFLLPYLICPHKKLTFVIKESLVSYPVFKHIMLSRNPIVVGRSSPREDFMTVLSEGTKRIEDNYSVVVFPQTTRMPEFDRSQFNSIGIKLARRARVPVIPLALKTDCWGNGHLIKDFGKIDPKKDIHLRFGEPLIIEGNGKIQQELVISHIENCLNQWNKKT